MRKRRGFTHWMSDHLPDKISDDLLLEEYQRLISGDQLARSLAANRIILGHVRLGMSTVAEFAVRSPHKTDEMVSSMLMALTYGTKKLSTGAVERHDGKPNITGYLMKTVRGRLLRTVTSNDGILRRSLSAYRKEQEKGIVVYGDSVLEKQASRRSESNFKELKEVVALAITKVQRNINTETTNLVQKIIDFRIDGLNDVDISDKLNLTRSRIQQIRKAVQTAILEKL